VAGVTALPTLAAELPALPSYVPRGTYAPVTTSERFRMPGRFGDMQIPELASILWKLDQGYLDSWYDLCEYAIASDATLFSLYETRKNRVEQAEWVIRPNQFGDQVQAKAAAHFCEELVGRCENWHEAQKHLLHAIFPGTAFAEMMWLRDLSGPSPTVFLSEIKPLHGHRFRFDGQWQARLWDQGMVSQRFPNADPMYGLSLRPDKFIVHTHQVVSGYPNVAGIMRAAMHAWVFKRWVDKMYIGSTERNGAPFVYMKVPANTPPATMEEIKARLEQFLGEHATVIKDGDELVIQETSVSTSGTSMHSVYLDRADRLFARLFLGASDAVDPGENGSNGAVNTRAGATMDPRMVTDGLGISSTMQRSAFKWGLQFNLHKFGGKCPPIPTIEAKTASDEVKTDVQDLAAQGGRMPEVSSGGDLGKSLDENAPIVSEGDDAQSSAAVTSAPVDVPKLADTAMNGAQISSLVDVLKTAASGDLPRDTVVALIKRGFNMDTATVEEIMGTIGKGWQPPSTEPSSAIGPPQISSGAATDPKALRRSARQQTKQLEMTHTQSPATKTSPISGRSATILAETLRGASVARRRL